uniref:AGC-kinase C-terminal domain-containing protein n=1 Tax=Knipowitschia caucasica TaxID=637954 RepID=A0AAV2KGH0_KNICA
MCVCGSAPEVSSSCRCPGDSCPGDSWQLKKTRKDTCNFDKEFTKMAVDLTPTDKLVIMNLDQDEFLGFSFVNAEYVAPNI